MTDRDVVVQRRVNWAQVRRLDDPSVRYYAELRALGKSHAYAYKQAQAYQSVGQAKAANRNG